MRRTAVVIATAALLAGCGSSTVVTADSLPPARQALECEGEPYDGGGADYDSGLASVQGSAVEALENLLEEDYLGRLPVEGYRVERDAGDRVLLSYDVGGRTKIAFVAYDGVGDYDGDQGWGIESWAQCDPAELPADVTNALGIEVWEDVNGRRVPLTEVESYPGPEHCDWQDITFLVVGGEKEGDVYLRDTRGELADFLRTTYEGAAELPEGATDTGWRRDGRQLWIGPDGTAAYLVLLSDTDDVERWLAVKDRVGCA